MTSRQWLLIDTEAAESKSVLTEVCLLVVEYTIATQQWKVVDWYHSLVNVNPATINRQASSFVYKQITGLSYSTLNRVGKPYAQVIADVHAFMNRYSWIPRFSRDPSVLDEPLLQLPPKSVYEVLTQLHQPYSSMFHNRFQRPVELHALAATKHCCSNHHPLVNGQHPHCAVSDVYEMFFWLMYFGKLH